MIKGSTSIIQSPPPPKVYQSAVLQIQLPADPQKFVTVQCDNLKLKSQSAVLIIHEISDNWVSFYSSQDWL